MAKPEIAIYMESHVITGEVVAGRSRPSDLLNNPTTNHLEVSNATWNDLLSEDGAPVSSHKVTIRKDHVQLAVPMDPPNVAAPRTLTLQIPIDLSVGPYLVRGALHRHPADPQSLLAVFGGFGRQFVALTGATIRYIPNPRFDIQVPNVLVNARHIRFWAMSS